MSGTAYGGGTIIPGQRKEDEKLVDMMNKFLESAANDDQSLPYEPNHWTKDDPTDVGSDSRNWRRCDKPQPQPILQPQWQEPPQPTRVTSYPYQGEMNSHPYGNGHGNYPPSYQREGSNRSCGTHPQNYHHVNHRGHILKTIIMSTTGVTRERCAVTPMVAIELHLYSHIYRGHQVLKIHFHISRRDLVDTLDITYHSDHVIIIITTGIDKTIPIAVDKDNKDLVGIQK